MDLKNTSEFSSKLYNILTIDYLSIRYESKPSRDINDVKTLTFLFHYCCASFSCFSGGVGMGVFLGVNFFWGVEWVHYTWGP